MLQIRRNAILRYSFNDLASHMVPIPGMVHVVASHTTSLHAEFSSA